MKRSLPVQHVLVPLGGRSSHSMTVQQWGCLPRSTELLTTAKLYPSPKAAHEMCSFSE